MRTFWLTFVLAGSLSLTLAQEQAAIDIGTYDSFLRQVAQQKTRTNVAGLTRTSVKDTLGFLTEQEVQALSSIADDLKTRTTSLQIAERKLVFEERLAAIASEPPSPSVGARLQDLNRQHSQTVANHVQQLRAALGDTGFQKIEGFIDSRKGSGEFFPLVSADGTRPESSKQGTSSLTPALSILHSLP